MITLICLTNILKHPLPLLFSVPVSIYGSHTGIIQFPFKGSLQTMSVQGWNMKGAEVICRELGYKGATAPFSTNESQLSVTSMCIVWINCTGNESSLSFCSMNYTSKCKANAVAIASVTCDPSEFGFQLGLWYIIYIYVYMDDS